MSKSEEMKRLEAAMASDKELREKFSKTVDRIAGEKTVQNDGDLFAKAAQEIGFNITAADFERLDAENEEVSTDELESVAGGVDNDNWCLKNYECYAVYECSRGEGDEYGHHNWCVTAWHCNSATLHTKTESDTVSCWKNYCCFLINKD